MHVYEYEYEYEYDFEVVSNENIKFINFTIAKLDFDTHEHFHTKNFLVYY